MYAGRGSDFAKALAISREITPLLQMRQGMDYTFVYVQ
jgi:hypothetical protein